MTDDVIEKEVADGIATLTLNRPESGNALNKDLVEQLTEVLNAIENDDDVRVVVLTGKGNMFCAGGDISRMRDRFERDTAPFQMRREVLEQGRDLASKLFHLGKPTIAKVDGAAIGAGLSLALACDLVFTRMDAKIGPLFANVALSLDYGASFLLPEMVGIHKAKELVFSGEPITGDEAAEIGLVNEAVESEQIDERVSDWAIDISTGPTEALVAVKHDLHSGVTSTFDEAIRNEAKSQGLLSATDDHEAAVKAFLSDDEAPDFRGH